MNRNITLVSLICIGIGAAAAAVVLFSDSTSTVQYETVPLTRGSIERVIATTGTLFPVGSVEVGTQVSGTVLKVYADFNDTVREGQIIAEIDKSLLLSRLSETQASLTRAGALYAQTEMEFERSEALHKKGLVSDQEFMRYQTDYLTQKASLQVARAALATANANVKYATIRSPVKGIVIKRNVEVGQTVAASLSAPTLFIIAEDLRKMKIMASVDETDIGKIKTDQIVRFSVNAYPDKNFSGEVSQIRLQPETVQNVVTYTVVVTAQNDEGILLPGMTANVEFVEQREENVLLVPSTAFRFQPGEKVVEKFSQQRRDQRERPGTPDSPSPERRDQDRSAMRRPNAQRRSVLWVLEESNELRPEYVRIGTTDGSFTSVSGSETLKEGIKIVTASISSDKKQNKSTRSLLPAQRIPGGRRM